MRSPLVRISLGLVPPTHPQSPHTHVEREVRGVEPTTAFFTQRVHYGDLLFTHTKFWAAAQLLGKESLLRREFEP